MHSIALISFNFHFTGQFLKPNQSFFSDHNSQKCSVGNSWTSYKNSNQTRGCSCLALFSIALNHSTLYKLQPVFCAKYILLGYIFILSCSHDSCVNYRSWTVVVHWVIPRAAQQSCRRRTWQFEVGRCPSRFQAVCASQFQYVYYDCLYVSESKLSTWQDQSHISVTNNSSTTSSTVTLSKNVLTTQQNSDRCWLGMLNDYRIFDYRIQCSFSFVSHSILGNTALRTHTPAKAGSVQVSWFAHWPIGGVTGGGGAPPFFNMGRQSI